MDTIGIYADKGKWRNDKGIIKRILSIIDINKYFLNIKFILKNGIMKKNESTSYL